MKTIKYISLLAALLLGAQGAFAQKVNPASGASATSGPNANPVIAAIAGEVDRNKDGLKMEDMAPPFFISYSVVDNYSYYLSASLGTISSRSESHLRRGVPMLLVGDYMRNNIGMRGGRPVSASVTSLTDNASGIPITIWGDLDDAYKDGAEQYKSRMAIVQQQTQTDEEQALPDFEQIPPVDMVLQPAKVNVDKAYWENYLRKASAAAKDYPDVLNSIVTLNIRNVMIYTYNTEGSRYGVPSTLFQLRFTAGTRASDGQDLSYTIQTENVTLEQMPDLATFTLRCRTAMDNLVKLKNAPVVDDAYSGPVLFEGEAVNDIFRRSFFSNDRLAAAPKPVQSGGNTVYTGGTSFDVAQAGANDLELMLGKKVISRSLTIKSITGQEFFAGQRLNGYYPIDAEGVVPDKELTLIDDGVLRGMLNGRRPTKKIAHSNGHARFDYFSNRAQVMPGNILITGDQTFSADTLRSKLLAAAKEEDLDYVYVVRQWDSGPNLFYKLYLADGREELVRGASLTDVNLKTFKRILGVSDKQQMATYGDVPVTIIAPGTLLVEEMDVTRTPNLEFKKPYIVPRPQ